MFENHELHKVKTDKIIGSLAFMRWVNAVKEVKKNGEEPIDEEAKYRVIVRVLSLYMANDAAVTKDLVALLENDDPIRKIGDKLLHYQLVEWAANKKLCKTFSRI